MSLPVRQQRVLEGIAETLRLTEPRLTAMFAIFSRLTRNEPTPRREQLAAPRRLACLAAILRWLPASPRSARRRNGGKLGWQRVLILSQVVIGVVLLAVLIGISSHAAAACKSATQRVVAAAGPASHLRACSAAAGSDVAPVGK
jgi:hypothetical protein